eukprot:15340933-Alexandrium_andersonii.AAC.1
MLKHDRGYQAARGAVVPHASAALGRLSNRLWGRQRGRIAPAQSRAALCTCTGPERSHSLQPLPARPPGRK